MAVFQDLVIPGSAIRAAVFRGSASRVSNVSQGSATLDNASRVFASLVNVSLDNVILVPVTRVKTTPVLEQQYPFEVNENTVQDKPAPCFLSHQKVNRLAPTQPKNQG